MLVGGTYTYAGAASISARAQAGERLGVHCRTVRDAAQATARRQGVRIARRFVRPGVLVKLIGSDAVDSRWVFAIDGICGGVRFKVEEHASSRVFSVVCVSWFSLMYLKAISVERRTERNTD